MEGHGGAPQGKMVKGRLRREIQEEAQGTFGSGTLAASGGDLKNQEKPSRWRPATLRGRELLLDLSWPTRVPCLLTR
jgi:hypothetical protein